MGKIKEIKLRFHIQNQISTVPNLPTNCRLKVRFQILDQYTEVKWLIHGTKHRFALTYDRHMTKIMHIWAIMVIRQYRFDTGICTFKIYRNRVILMRSVQKNELLCVSKFVVRQLLSVAQKIFLTHWGLKIWPTICNWHCQMHFLERTLLCFDWNTTEVCSYGHI